MIGGLSVSSKINNEFGVISIDNEVVSRLAGQAVMECAGVVGMAAKNVKDGFVQLLKKENLSKGIILTPDEGAIALGIHIVVEYGTSIPAIAETMQSNIKYRVEEYTGVKISRVNIFVDGVRVE